MKKISYVLLLLILNISLNVKGATFTETILNDNGGKDVISKKGSVDITQQSPIVNSYKESNFYNKTTQKISSEEVAGTIYYSSAYTFDSASGNYSLDSIEQSVYSESYKNLIGKYFIEFCIETQNKNCFLPSSSLTIYKITSATYSETDNTGTIEYEQSVALPVIDSSTSGMYATKDNYGTSYFFRGGVTNNWVKFGKYNKNIAIIYNSTAGTTTKVNSCDENTTNYFCTQISTIGEDMYWRIIRINGDNTIRLIYAGTTPPTQNESLNNNNNIALTSLGAYNDLNGDNMYAGYMYESGKLRGYATDSTIKIRIDNWYKENFIDYSPYLADNGFCNDRTAYTDETGTTLGGGTGNTDTYYNPYIRITNNKATLKCENKDDLFTVNDTENGNGRLTYPIGLITSDEAFFAGYIYNNRIMRESNNTGNYLFFNEGTIFTMSPSFAIKESVTMLVINPTVSIFAIRQGQMENVAAYNTSGDLPVINLSSSLNVTGKGTWDDPYIPKLEESSKVEEVIENPKTGITLTSIVILLLITSILVPVTFILKKEKIKKV
jgi:hypothetical protein